MDEGGGGRVEGRRMDEGGGGGMDEGGEEDG